MAYLSDWRANCSTGNDNWKYMLENGLYTDVCFRVGRDFGEDEEFIQAHRLVLVTFSSVFEVMLMGNFREGSKSITEPEPIEVPDISPQTFKTMLTFMYTGDVGKDFDLLSLVYCAKKYDVRRLIAYCLPLLSENLSDKNAVTIFQLAQMVSETELEKEAYTFIRSNFHVIMKEADFLNIDYDNLCLFLKDDETAASELDIFRGMLRWARSKCEKKGIEPTPQNLREEMRSAFHLIRFPIIPGKDLSDEVISAEVLTQEEALLLLRQKLADKSKALTFLHSLRFTSEPRRFLYKATFFTMDDIVVRPNEDRLWNCGSLGYHSFHSPQVTFPCHSNHLQSPELKMYPSTNRFSVDQPISVVSFGFYGPVDVDSAPYVIKMRINLPYFQPNSLHYDLGKECYVGAANYQGVELKKGEIVHVQFPKPVLLQPNITYEAFYLLKGPKVCAGPVKMKRPELLVPVNSPFENYSSVKFKTYEPFRLPEIVFDFPASGQ